MVEAAGIEPASASPTHTGSYMLSLSIIWLNRARQTGSGSASLL